MALIGTFYEAARYPDIKSGKAL